MRNPRAIRRQRPANLHAGADAHDHVFLESRIENRYGATRGPAEIRCGIPNIDPEHTLSHRIDASFAPEGRADARTAERPTRHEGDAALLAQPGDLPADVGG